jgi:hypothetical protein
MDTQLSRFVEQVVNARPALRESIRQPLPELTKLVATAAFKKCAEFLGEDPDNPNVYRVLSLLLTLAVLQSSDVYSRKEGLCLLGVRGVDAYECERGERRKMAALARRKPLHDVDWYVKRHLPRTVARITGNLRALVEHPELLEEALACDGKTALIKHVY